MTYKILARWLEFLSFKYLATYTVIDCVSVISKNWPMLLIIRLFLCLTRSCNPLEDSRK